MEMAKSDWATGEETTHLARHFEERLEEAGSFPETEVEGMKTNLRNMWSRLPLTRADKCHGMLRQMVRWKEKGP